MSLAPIPSDLIKKTAGEARFQAGLQAAQHAQVMQLELLEKGAQGFVDHHRVKIERQGEQLSGNCDCDDSDGFDFCTHCVVLSLFANRQTQARRSLAKGPDRSKVLAYLLNLDKHSLAKHLLDIIENDADLFKRYVLKAALESAEIDYSDLRRQITAITRHKDRLFSQRQVKHFFVRIEQFLEELALATPDAPERMLKLLDYLIQRLGLILDRTDDRAGLRLPSAARLTQMHQRMFAQLEGRSTTLAKRFFECWQLDRHELLQASPDAYLAADALPHFITALYQAWPQATPEESRRIARTLYRMQAIDLSRKEGIAMRISLAKEAQDWLDLADALMQETCSTQAIQVLEQARTEFPEHTGIACHLARLFLGESVGEEDAVAQQRLAELCAAHPEHISPLVFPDLAPAPSADQGKRLSPLQTLCYEHLQGSAQPAAQATCLAIQLHCGDGDAAVRTLATLDAPHAQQMLACAQLMETNRPDTALQLVRQCFELLLAKARPSADRELADLLIHFPIQVDAHHEQALIDEFRTRILRRPAIVEALRRAEHALERQRG